MTNKTSQKGSLEPDQEATTSSKIKNQAGSISNDKQKENHSEQNQNTEVQSNTRTHEESTEDQSNTRTHEKSTEDQSNTRTHEKSSEDQSNARTQEKSSEDQSNTRTHEKSIKIKQSNQSNITSPSKNTHKAVQVNTPNKETKNREQQISKESKMVEKEVRRSPRKRGQTNTEDQSPEKIQRVSDSSVATAEREGISIAFDKMTFVTCLIHLCRVDFSTQLFGLVHFQKQGVWLVLLLHYFIEVPVFNANSVDPDQMPHSAVSDLDQHCLLLSLLRDGRHK